MKKQVWFWQIVLSPHMIYLANELAKRDVDVHYVCAEGLSKDRERLGWAINYTDDVNIHTIKSNEELEKILLLVGENAEHICSSIRANGYIKKLQKKFIKQNQKFWIIMETVDVSGYKGGVKKIIYSYYFNKYKSNIKGILAIGYTLPNWLGSLGFSKDNVYPFMYFLNKSELSVMDIDLHNKKFSFIFVGNLIKRKQPELLLKALNRLTLDEKKHFELIFIGNGKLEKKLKKYVTTSNLDVKFLGAVNINDVRLYLGKSDCLLLPSIHDGWGAVVSEALIEGASIICSNTCGSAGLVKISKYGMTFDYDDEDGLLVCLKKIISDGKISKEKRIEIKSWAKDLNVESGADYLYSILFDHKKIIPAWAKNCL